MQHVSAATCHKAHEDMRWGRKRMAAVSTCINGRELPEEGPRPTLMRRTRLYNGNVGPRLLEQPPVVKQGLHAVVGDGERQLKAKA